MRLIRTVMEGGEAGRQKLLDLDAITDPQLLAHSLISLKPKAESFEYSTYLRCSGLHDVCVREKILGWRTHRQWSRSTPVGLQLTFEIGNAVHHHLQNSGNYFYNNFLGWWKCLNCGSTYFGKRPLQGCVHCRASSPCIQYSEYSLRMEDPYRVTGHIDGFLEVAPGEFRVVDFKTCSGADFDKLIAAKGDHVIQVSAYMGLLKYDPNLPVKFNERVGYVAYIPKRHQSKGFPIKIFRVDRSQEVDRYVKSVLDSFVLGLRDESYLPAPISDCITSDFCGTKAKYCCMSDLCSDLYKESA